MKQNTVKITLLLFLLALCIVIRILSIPFQIIGPFVLVYIVVTYFLYRNRGWAKTVFIILTILYLLVGGGNAFLLVAEIILKHNLITTANTLSLLYILFAIMHIAICICMHREKKSS